MGLTKVNINGKEYPCRETMGAVLRFKRETGQDISKALTDTETMITYIWCCISSACAQDNVEFGMSLIEFADAMPLDIVKTFLPKAGPGSKKK